MMSDSYLFHLSLLLLSTTYIMLISNGRGGGPHA